MTTNLELISQAQTWSDVEKAIQFAVAQGILVDKRTEMPRGRRPNGEVKEWRKRATPADVLGHCVHQNGSQNFTRPKSTAEYHTSPKQHIVPGKPLPSACYLIMIPDIGGPAWLTGDLDWITYAQGANDIGDENRHLIPVLVMGGFEDDGFKRKWTKNGPSEHQLSNFEVVTDWLQRVFGYGGEGFFGHYHFGKDNCPGRDLRYFTQAARDADNKSDLVSDTEWQQAILRWNPQALPVYGADGDWGKESKYWLGLFQRAHNIRRTAFQDPFTELVLLQRYPEQLRLPVEVLPVFEVEEANTAPSFDLTDGEASKSEIRQNSDDRICGVCGERFGSHSEMGDHFAVTAVEQTIDPEDPPDSDW